VTAFTPGTPRTRSLDPDAARAALDQLVVLDVREAEAFTSGHLPHSGNLPWPELPDRIAELPPRDTDLLIVAEDTDRAERAADWLAERAGRPVAFLASSVEALRDAGWTTGAPERLWRPAPFLESVLSRIKQDLATRTTRRAADLACGSGRESVFLAMAGFQVEGWDADPFALDQARRLAERHGVLIETRPCDLEAREVPLPQATYDLVTCFRFLQRPLFPAIERSLAPGGWLVYETYRRGQEQFGRPKRRRFLLKDGELGRAFPGLEIMEYHEQSPPGGPWTARLLARKGHP
jgi:tellurite methyltransferase